MPRGPRCPRSFRNSLRRHGAARHGRDEPASGHRDRRRNAAPRRQRRRRRDCGERRARAYGADELRHRRRPVRHRLGRGQRTPARLERERPLAAVADARPAAGNGARTDSRPRPAQRQRARRRRRLVRAARTLRPLAVARAPRTVDRLRARGFSRDGSHRRVVGRGCECTAEHPGFAEVFMPNGRAPAIGELFTNPALARAYALIANEGRGAFYDGPIAAAIEGCVRGNGGFLGAEDLAAHRSEWVEPVSTTYRGWSVFELPPNGQGIAVLQMLNILEGFDLGSLEWGSAEHLHLLIEAKKLAFEDRARFYADPKFAAVPTERLIAKDYAAARRALIDPQARRSGADSWRCDGRRRRHGLSRDGRRGRQHGLADPEQLHGLRLRHDGRDRSASVCRTAARSLRSTRSTRMPTSPASGRSTRSSRRSRCATAKPCSRSG